MKRFKSKKKINLKKYVFLFVIIIISFYLTFNLLMSSFSKIKVDNEKLIKYLINEGFNNQISNFNFYNPLNLVEPLQLIQSNLDFKVNNEIKSSDEFIETIEINNENTKEPLIYIYNTHDEEAYKYNKYQPYSIVPNVKLASYILKERLMDLGINSLVETRSIKKILQENNWPYRYSYIASRIPFEDIVKNNKNIKYFIDIHRDSADESKVIFEKDGKKYARILFVVGLEHDNYMENLNLAEKLTEMLNEEMPGLSRGISKKEGPGVNGVYNQDISGNSMLIEIGGDKNSIDEVNNSINILANCLYKYIKGDNNAKEKI